ncbi:hypothetical protein AQS8620_02251 [Aquimixticola soesokkakensis]|uniref:Uncharacterized protein n=1 Tax=Aquimixticola soesokkakensis TaxID=1519096 RepID=A0A1Y5T1G8_9RHOB|nr:hypothetical protein AQS8620_02251 [Aquimixticola soesokkakensis]
MVHLKGESSNKFFDELMAVRGLLQSMATTANTTSQTWDEKTGD